MKQQDWIDFFQAVNGRNPSIQEMAEAAQKGEFVRETPKQTVEVTETVSQKETVETTNGSEVVDPTGAGDSFCGGFLVGYSKTGNLLTAAKYGTVSSSFIIEDFGIEGALKVTKEMARERLKQVTCYDMEG